VSRIADIAGEEVEEALGRLAADQRGEPVDDHDEERDDPEQRKPDEMRDEQEQSEEDRQPRALEIVGHDEADRMCGGRGHPR
jgi:hypothetical protein